LGDHSLIMEARKMSKKSISLSVVQCDNDYVKTMKIVAASRNVKLYSIVNEAFELWREENKGEIQDIRELFNDFLIPDS
jgi:hypothetical protein